MGALPLMMYVVFEMGPENTFMEHVLLIHIRDSLTVLHGVFGFIGTRLLL
jgi:hypothetical protein